MNFSLTALVRRPARWARLLINGLLFITLLSAQAQTTWTNRPQTANQLLKDIAFGAGRYVVVGGDGAGEFVQTSTDGNMWSTQLTDHPNSGGLFALIYAAGKFVAVGGQGRVLTSTDGLIWTPQVSGTDNALNDITYGAGQFLAVGDYGTLITSTDGSTWNPQVSGTPQHILAITYGAGMFIMTGHDGMIKTSADGAIWMNRQSGTASTLRSITTGPTGLLVAVGNNSAVTTSLDGLTWTLRPGPGALLDLSGVACNPVTGKFVAVARAKNQVLTSPNGLQWSDFPSKSGTDFYLFGVRFLNGQFLAVGEGHTIRSSTLEGIAWNPLTINRDIQFKAVAYGNGSYVAVGKYPIQLSPAIGSVAVSSTDGINFSRSTTEHFAGAGEGLNEVVYGNGQFVAVGGEAIIQTSVDGKAWTIRHATLSATINGVAYGGGQYVAVGAGLGPGTNGNVIRSADGITWATSSSGPSIYYQGIHYANAQFVAVGSTGVIGTSPDGVVWTPRQSSTNKLLKSVVYGNGMYVAVGADGIVVKSTNSTNWTTIQAFTSTTLNHVTFGNGTFVVVGENGAIFTSTTGDGWSERISHSSGNALSGVAYGNGQFIAVGANATITTSANDGEIPVNPESFAITGVNLLACQPTEAGKRLLSFSPQYTGLSGQPISFSVVNELSPTTAAGPYSLSMYTDNPTITLKATQTGSGGEASFTYNWLEACSSSLPPSTDFSITGVTDVTCAPVGAGQRILTFTPTYAGLNGQERSFWVINERVPTTSAGPYTLNLYTDNPTITLKATQTGSSGEASFIYNWLENCGVGARRGVEPTAKLQINLLGNPVTNTVEFEVTGAEGVDLSLSLTDMQNRQVGQLRIEQAGQLERLRLPVNSQPAGVLLLRVSTLYETKTVRILKAN